MKRNAIVISCNEPWCISEEVFSDCTNDEGMANYLRVSNWVFNEDFSRAICKECITAYSPEEIARKLQDG